MRCGRVTVYRYQTQRMVAIERFYTFTKDSLHTDSDIPIWLEGFGKCSSAPFLLCKFFV